VGAGIALVLVLAIGLALYQWHALERFRQRTPLPGQLVDVGGHQLHIHCTGSGAPTVVIDAGNACFGLEWTPIQDQLSDKTRVCTYDRAGYGWSEAGPSPRDAATAVAELHDLLQAAKETGPYILVGHSLGGTNAMPETTRKLAAELQDTYLNLLLDPQQYETAIDEMAQLSASLRQVGEAMSGDHPLDGLPLIVLTAGQRMAPGSTPFDDRRIPVGDETMEAQRALSALSTRGEQRVIRESGHQVHLDAPEAVVAVVCDVVGAIP
jgi:pimeloyl-ACP methyl ester carboxylesterase